MAKEATRPTMKIFVDSCRPETRQEVARLFKEGWEIMDIELQDKLGHYLKKVSGCDIYFYVLTKPIKNNNS